MPKIEKPEYRSPTGHSFKDKEFSTCFDILIRFLSDLRSEFEGGATDDSFEYTVFYEMEKARNEKEPNLTDCELSLLIFLRDKISGWVILKDRDNPKYVSLPFWTKEYNKWRNHNGV